MIMTITLGVSPKHGIAIIKVFQMADYFLYYNADTPANLAGFLQIFANTPLDYCPNPFATKAFSEGTCTPPKKFEENEISCYILANIGQYLMQLFVIY